MEDFIRKQIAEDIKNGVVVHTRFPPEPNGYLHIGHAKAIILNFEIAREFGGVCNLRFDDTNPERESDEFVRAIKHDVKALGYTWNGGLYYASDYFEQFYEYALKLIRKGLAYVDHSTPDEIRAMRGTPTQTGTENQFRERSIEENETLFADMRAGKYPGGACVLRAKIDMKHPNIVMRDPPVYRIKHVTHHNTADAWCIYPMYDFAHCLSDAIEGITHSLCTLEFEIHRPLYDWFLEAVDVPKPGPKQREFARLNITHTVLSKRVLKQLVDSNIVDGWDDPRMPTLSGMRRRGYSARAIREFCNSVRVTKVNSTVAVEKLEEAVRSDLNERAMRVMVVLDPIKLVITNYPEGKEEYFEAENNPEQENSDTHTVAFARELYIERDDFMENAPSKYFRLSVGREVRLKYAYYVTCTRVIKNKNGSVCEVHAEYDPASRGGWSDDGRKVKGTLHWVSATHACDVEVRMYDRLFEDAHPEVGGSTDDIISRANKNSRTVIYGAKAEPYIMERVSHGNNSDELIEPPCMQFLRVGYFSYDAQYSAEQGIPVFNGTVRLKDARKRKNTG